MQDGRKTVWSISYISVAFFPSLKQNFIAYRSSKMSSRPDWIFEIHELWQSGFCGVYFNSSYSCPFESEIIKISQSSHKIYSNNIVNFQVSTTILNACTKKVWKPIEGNTYILLIALCEMNINCCRRCLWCNGYRRRKWTRRHEFKSWTRLIAFHRALIPLGKVWIQLFSLQLWVNSRADLVLQPWWGNWSRRRKTLN